MSKQTVLELVQKTLSAMDSDLVDSINETAESVQVADILEDTYYELINRLHSCSQADWLTGPLAVVAAADPANPTAVSLADTVRELHYVAYEVDGVYRELVWCPPDEFVKRYNSPGDNRQLVTLPTDVSFYVHTNAHPKVYTSFDDETIVCDSVDTSVETTLQQAKFSCTGVRIPSFTIEDSHVPDMPAHVFPMLLASLKEASFLYLKQSQSPLDSARVQRQMSQWRRKRNRVGKKNPYFNSNYGRNR